MTFGIKVYTYKTKLWPATYYMTINGLQVFGGYGSIKDVELAIERVKKGERP